LPVVNGAIVVYDNDGRELEREDGCAKGIHNVQVIEVLRDEDAVADNEDGAVHAGHQIEELEVFVSYLVIKCFRFRSVPVKVGDRHLNRLKEQKPLDSFIFINFRKIAPYYSKYHNCR
tara:strand:- start:275 stop:628 length:354 start_codon:yes stop_codon:yes gene_type:complete